jgi:hypothetical protein
VVGASDGDGRRGGVGRDPGLRGEVLTVEGLTQHLASPLAHPKPGPTRGNASWASAVALRVVWCRSPRPRVDDGPGRRLSGAPAQPTGLSRAGLSARGVRTLCGVGQWTAGVVAQLLAWLPA